MGSIWHRPAAGSIWIFGQSNARAMADGTFANCDWGAVTYAGNFYNFRSLDDPTRMNAKSLADDWQEGSGLSLYEDATIMLSQAFKGVGHVLFWAQGEEDATVEADANAYQTNFDQFVTDVHADTGLSAGELAWAVVRLHSGNTNTYAATVRAAHEAVVASPPTVVGGTANMATINVDDITLDDGVHWTAAERSIVGNRMLATANTLYGYSQKDTGL